MVDYELCMQTMAKKQAEYIGVMSLTSGVLILGPEVVLHGYVFYDIYDVFLLAIIRELNIINNI